MFYWVQIWRLARPLQDLEMLLTEPLLSCLCCVFGVIVMLEDLATTHLQCSYWGKEVVCQILAIHGPIHPPLNTVQSSCPLCRKAPPKHDVSSPMPHGWDGVLGIVLILLLPPNTASGVYTKSSILVSSDHMTFSHASSGSSRWSLAKFHTGLDMCWHNQQPDQLYAKEMCCTAWGKWWSHQILTGFRTPPPPPQYSKTF